MKTAAPSDDGTYKCIVSNRLGNISHNIILTVISRYILWNIKFNSPRVYMYMVAISSPTPFEVENSHGFRARKRP